MITSAHAGYATGDVGKVLVGRNGQEVYIELVNASITDFPCASSHPNHYQYAFSLQSHAAGKAMLSVILAAKSTGHRIFIQATGACTIDSRIEDLSYVIAL
jgi:hypothetical protein